MFRNYPLMVSLVIACGSSPTLPDRCDELVWVAEPEALALRVESVVDAEAFPPYTRIEGRLVVSDAPGLADLQFLECVEFVRELSIVSLPDLTTLSGLERLETVDDEGRYVGYDLSIVDNPRLEDVAGLHNLGRAGGLFISNNAVLESLEGLESLESAGEIWILDNQSLTTVGLRALRSGTIHIGTVDCSTNVPVARGNPSLVAIDGLDVFPAAVNEVSGNSSLLTIDGLPDGEWTAIKFNASLPYTDILALDAMRSGEFLSCGNLDEPEPCTCPPGNPP